MTRKFPTLYEIDDDRDEPPFVTVNTVHNVYPLKLSGEEGERLLAWLAQHSTYVAVSRPDDDNPFEETEGGSEHNA